MNKVERARFDLEMILPYVNHLKEIINQDRRMEVRGQQQRLIYGEEVVIFRRERIAAHETGHSEDRKPRILTNAEKLEICRAELADIAESAKYFSNGDKI